MRISIFGMGYVGAVCAACLAEEGHSVVGVDISELKVDLINRGKSPVVEPGLDDLLHRNVSAGRLRATTHTVEAIAQSELSMICVGTPGKHRNGVQDLSFIETVSREIGAALKDKSGYHTVVVRSTVLPGTVRQVVIPLLEQASGKRAGADFGVATNPEFLRESTAIKDFFVPPMTVIGEFDAASGEQLASLYWGLPAQVIRKTIEVAEMVKYVCNAWHAVKITFANEVGNIAKALGVDGREVMGVICADKKLNISDHYMRPGFAFGGSCLPKDVRALSHRAAQLDVQTPLLSSLLPSNSMQIQNAVDLITSYDKRRIGMLGLSFKAGTDDLRESPLVELAETLIGKGYQLSIYDRNVEYARVNGANRDYINSKIPHVSSLLKSDLQEVVDSSDVMILGNSDQAFEQVLRELPEDKRALDLVGFMPNATNGGPAQGICW